MVHDEDASDGSDDTVGWPAISLATHSFEIAWKDMRDVGKIGETAARIVATDVGDTVRPRDLMRSASL